MREIAAHEQDLLKYATEKLTQIPGLKIIGTAKQKLGVISFILEGVHPMTLAQFLMIRVLLSAPDTTVRCQ